MADIKQITVGSTTYNIEPVTAYLPLTGGTMTGALNFKNNTWNTVGDDVYIGDYNEAGSLGIKGANGQTNIGFINQSNGYYIKLASPGVTANRTITMPDDSGTIALTKNIPTSLPANGGNADTLDGKHASDFYLSSSNITNLPINGGIYWNSYVESSTDGSDAASITVIRDGNGNGGTVLQIKQANDANDIVNVVAGDLRLNGTSVSTYGHTHSKSEVGLGNVDNTADANKSVAHAGTADVANSVAWGNVSGKPSTFTPSSHTHDDRYYTESEINSKLDKKSNTGHTHNYLPLSGGALTGTLDLQNHSAKIQFSNDWYITNIEVGSKSVTLQGNNGAETYVEVTYSNGSKGNGTWYMVATASGNHSDNVSIGLSNTTNTGFRLWVRNVYPASSRTFTINWIAIKYW